MALRNVPIEQLCGVVTVDIVLDNNVFDIVLKCLYFTLQMATDIAWIIQRDEHDRRIFLKKISSNIYRNKETPPTIINFKHIQTQ